MEGYLTDSFVKKLPANLKASWLPGNSAFSDFFKSVSRGYLQVAVSDESFFHFIDNLRMNEPDLAKTLIGLESSGKLRAVHTNSSIPGELNISGIRKGAKKQISSGLNIPASTIFHDFFENHESREKISVSTKKPLFLEIDLTAGSIEYLFREKSFNLDIGNKFSWIMFISDYTLPFQKIRILDPHLYKYFDKVDLSGLLRVLAKKCSNPTIEIISRGEESEIKKIKGELDSLKNLNADIRLYNQLSDVSRLFHKRVVWTDFWVLLAERGFDFLKPQNRKGLREVQSETNLFLTGKYASRKSIWHQIENNWEEYLSQSNKI